MLDGRLDQRFAVRAGDQHGGRDEQFDRPERTLAGDVGERFARQPACQQRREPRRDIAIEAAEQQRLARRPERVRHQQFGIEARRVAGGDEARGGGGDGGTSGLH